MNRILGSILARMASVAPGGYSLRPWLQQMRGVRMGQRVWISQRVYLDEVYPEAITIGDNCTIGLRTSIFSHFHWGPRHNSGGFKPVVIEANVFIGPHCLILPGVTVGEGAVIKAGSVLTKNVPSRVFWGDPGGRPLARITAPLDPDSSYDEFVKGLRPFPEIRRTRQGTGFDRLTTGAVATPTQTPDSNE